MSQKPCEPPSIGRRLVALEEAARELWSQLDNLGEFSKLAVRAGFRDAAARVAAGEADKLFPQSDEDDLSQESRLKLRARRTARKQRHVEDAVRAAERKLEEVSSYVGQLREAIHAGRRNQLPPAGARRPPGRPRKPQSEPGVRPELPAHWWAALQAELPTLRLGEDTQLVFEASPWRVVGAVVSLDVV
jgi:hypothetical protein